MSKIVLDELPKEPKDCPFCEVHTHYYNNYKYYMCHLRESMDFDCKYALGECVGCENCGKLISFEQANWRNLRKRKEQKNE